MEQNSAIKRKKRKKKRSQGLRLLCRNTYLNPDQKEKAKKNQNQFDQIFYI